MNVELLNKVVKFHEEMPERFVMDTWCENLTPGEELEPDLNGLAPVPPCGTVACIAGTVNILSGKADEAYDEKTGLTMYYAPPFGWYTDARKSLDLTHEQANRLFYHKPSIARFNGANESWPEEFSNAYLSAKTPQERVEVLKARVARFIATDGQE